MSLGEVKFSDNLSLLTIQYQSKFITFNLKKAVPFWVVALFAAGLAVVSLKPSVVLFLLVLSYAVSGYVLWSLGKRVRPAA